MVRSKTSTLILALLLLGQLFTLQPAAAAPRISLLNPSPLAPAQVPELATSAGPLHFVAWVQDVPPSPQAEFEVELLGGPIAAQPQTIDGLRVGTTDTWEAMFTPPSSLPEGQYEVTARLFSEGQEVASASQIATLDRAEVGPAADSVEIEYPANGQPFGLFKSGDGLRARINVSATSTTDQVQVFYSTSDPGAPPEWISCGRQIVDRAQATVPCRIPGVATAGEVAAVAAVANNTPPPGDPQRVADDGMDAHRVMGYPQMPSQVSITPSTTRVDVGACRIFSASVVDQLSQPIVGVGVDVHADGPTDQLRFATADTTPLANDTDPFQAPNESHISRESATRCSDHAVDGQQGDHNMIGVPDRKHIESVAGTGVDGSFRFALTSDAAGSSAITAWADVQEDDFQSASEASGVAVVGWGQEPPAPAHYVFLDPDLISASTETCRRIVAVARDGADPIASTNIDLHLKDPPTARFCSPGGAHPRKRPDGGGHSGALHTDGTRHAEGMTDAMGRFVFGVTSPSSGDSTLTVWLDLFDDDLQASGEPSAGGRISWVREGERAISIRASKRNVRSGDTIEISGEIFGDPACENDQPVVLRAREEGTSTFVVIGRTTTNPRGFYTFSVEVTSTRDYRSVAPRARDPRCLKARSHVISVRSR